MNVLAERKLSLKPGKTDMVPITATLVFRSFEFDGLTRRIARPKVDEFNAHVSRVLEQANGGTLSELRRELQNVVTGWYNYFGGASVEIDRQLAELDLSLHRRVTEHPTRLGLNGLAIDLLVGAIADPARRPIQPAGYPELAGLLTGRARDNDSAPASASQWMFSKRYALASQAIAADQAPVMSSRGHLYVRRREDPRDHLSPIGPAKRSASRRTLVAYGEIVEVIDAGKGAGVDRVGIITEGMRRAADR